MAQQEASAGERRARQEVVVVWFKFTDLRTHDHEALCAAHASGLPVLHVFVFDPRWYKKTPLCGFPRTGALRARFQLEALDDLSTRLNSVGHFLCVRRGKSTADVFDEICSDFKVAGVYASREVCSEELRVENSVRQVLEKRRAGRLHLLWTFELHHYDDLPEYLRLRGSNSYTGYKDAFHGMRPRKPLRPPSFKETAGVQWQRADDLPTCVTELGLEPATPDPRAELQWVGGETAALARVQHYLFESDAIALDYVGSTNTPREGNSCTKMGAMSRLSPWLAHGCISARQLHVEIKRYERERHKSGSTYWIVHELYWRDFVRFQSFLVGDRIFRIGGLYNKHPDWPWSDDMSLLHAWMKGATGFPFLDAALREIEATGYSCHVGRETAAWFLICDLGLDWRMGAEWFESILIDYEPAANWFCWVFVCLIRATGGNGFREIGHPHLPPQTRLQTVEVVFLSAQHDPDGEYIKLWVPELRDLPDGLCTREPWREFCEPLPAVPRAQHRQAFAASPGPDRIQMARRTLTQGGSCVAVWWQCSRDVSAPKTGRTRWGARNIESWPEGYPLPLFPPSSFFDIEKVAEKARYQQRMKAERMARLRQELGSPRLHLRAPMDPSSSANADAQRKSNQKGKGKGKQSSKGRNKGHADPETWQAHAQQIDMYIDTDNVDVSGGRPAQSAPKRRWTKKVAEDRLADFGHGRLAGM